MEFNLKKYPCVYDLNGRNPLADYYRKAEKWKRGFEAELRELARFFEGNTKYLKIVREAHQEMIEEILGDA